MTVARATSILLCCVLLVGCAAQRHLDQARAASLRSDYAAAVVHYERALTAQPSLHGSEKVATALRRARAQAAYEQGRAHQRAHAYDQAAQAYRSAMDADPTFEPPAAALRAMGPAAGRWLFEQAGALIDEGRLARAIETLQHAQHYDPDNAAIRARLHDTLALSRERREQVEALLAQSDQAAAAGAWDEAVQHAQAAADLIPDDQTLTARVLEVRHRATDELIARGRVRMAQGELDDAAALLERAADFAPDDTPVRHALADVASSRARAAQAAGRHGAALAHYRAAAGHHPDPAARSALVNLAAQARAALLEPWVTDVHLHADDADLLRMLGDRLDHTGRGLLRHADAGLEIVLHDTHLDVDVQRISTRHATHSYTVIERHPNRRLDLLAAQLHHARADLHDLRRRHDIHCPHCHGAGYFVHKQWHKKKGKHVRVKQRCGACAGTGRLHHHLSDLRLRREASRVDSLQHQLAREPAFIEHRVPASWDYQVHTYRMTATMSTTLTLGDRDPTTLRETYTVTDTTSDGANPAIGLHDNPLHLPSDSDVRTTLHRKMSVQAGRLIVAVLLQNRLAQIEQQRAHAEHGDAAAELDYAAHELRAAIGD